MKAESDFKIFETSKFWKILYTLAFLLITTLVVLVSHRAYKYPEQFEGAITDPWSIFGLIFILFIIILLYWSVWRAYTTKLILGPSFLELKKGNTRMSYPINNFKYFHIERISFNGIPIDNYILVDLNDKNLRLPAFLSNKYEIEDWLLEKIPTIK